MQETDMPITIFVIAAEVPVILLCVVYIFIAGGNRQVYHTSIYRMFG